MASLDSARPTYLHDVGLTSSLGTIPFSLEFASRLTATFVFLAAELKCQLAKLAAVIATHAFAENTNKGYASHIKSWLLFCLYFEFPSLPATDAGLAQYLVFQAQTVSPSSLQIYMCGIRSFHIDNGFTWPHVSSRPLVHRTMRGLKRFWGRPETEIRCHTRDSHGYA